MRTMLVLRQLSAVLDQKLAEVTRKKGITPQDALAMGWMAQVPGISGSNIADLVGRKRQNVHASLVRLARLGLVVKYPASYSDRTVGWGLSDQGQQLWLELEEGFQSQERFLERLGVSAALHHDLETLIGKLRLKEPVYGSPGLIELPEEPKPPSWDL